MPKLEPVQLDITTKSDGKGIQDAEKKLTGFGGTLQKIGTIAAGIGLANLGQQFLTFGKEFLASASQEATNFTKAMTTLDIIAGRFGESGQKAQEAAKALGSELRIGVGPAAEGLQNLLKSGLDLDTASELMKRFTNEAITGKSPTISLGQAVQNLTFAYATNNSALGNLSGVSENFSDIIKKGEEALIKEGVAAEDITEDMAKLKGMMDLTNLTMGSAERFTGTLVDKQAQLDQKITDIKVALGEGLNTALAAFIGMVIDSGILDKLVEFAGNFDKIGEKIKPLTEALEEHRAKIEAIGLLLSIGLLPHMVMLATQLGINTGLWIVHNIQALAANIVSFGLLITKGYEMIAMFVIKAAQLAINTTAWTVYHAAMLLVDILTGRLTLSMIAQKAALVAVNTWTALVTAAQWAWNVAMSANPIGLVILLIAGLVAGIVIAIGKWDAFKEAAVKAIEWVLDKVKQLVEWLGRLEIPGLGKIGDLIKKIPGFANGVQNFSGGLAMVGEKGPELVELPRGSNVIPNHQLGSHPAMRPITVTQNINSGIDMEFAFRELAYVLRNG